ncbi:hypothetical protein [Micromonospora aurantiaca (nom. illeg.)]|uniref:hypothetical protein n=1 Tax=Micromonospora aurantiaca (nom. illeg.) TaxID=47850 RepID=UPI00165751AC|nr:hypothetical protein [Micromonospora aurantiaca]MBC9001302.1 hypothetical protein [Micromonospora aurantiaca]
MNGRPRPVLYITMALAGLAAVTGFAGLADLLPATVILWLLLVQAVAVAVSGVYLQSVVTPLADPRDGAGRRLAAVRPGDRRELSD